MCSLFTMQPQISTKTGPRNRFASAECPITSAPLEWQKGTYPGYHVFTSLSNGPGSALIWAQFLGHIPVPFHIPIYPLGCLVQSLPFLLGTLCF